MDKNDITRIITTAAADIKLKDYQLKVCETVVMYLSQLLAQNNVAHTQVELDTMQMYHKVMNSDNAEQAEAHFVGLADKFCQQLGLGDFDSLSKKFSNYKENNDVF